MNRTRIVFFGFVALFLALIVVGLLGQGLPERFVQQLFVASAIFGVGVVLLDMLGLLGHHAADAGDAGGSGDHMAGHLDHGAHDGLNGHGNAGGHAGGGDAHAHGDHSSHDAQSHDQSQVSHNLLSALVYLRLLVYFCLGFGPIGWAAMGNGWGALRALAFAAPVGVLAVFLATAFFRFQRKDTDSSIAPSELVAQDAVVVVPLDDRTMGKVRVKVGMNVSDLYALAATPGLAFEKGQPVRIERVTDECVYVR